MNHDTERAMTDAFKAFRLILLIEHYPQGNPEVIKLCLASRKQIVDAAGALADELGLTGALYEPFMDLEESDIEIALAPLENTHWIGGGHEVNSEREAVAASYMYTGGRKWIMTT